jgi:hypothetical protein
MFVHLNGTTDDSVAYIVYEFLSSHLRSVMILMPCIFLPQRNGVHGATQRNLELSP